MEASPPGRAPPHRGGGRRGLRGTAWGGGGGDVRRGRGGVGCRGGRRAAPRGAPTRRILVPRRGAAAARPPPPGGRGGRRGTPGPAAGDRDRDRDGGGGENRARSLGRVSRRWGPARRRLSRVCSPYLQQQRGKCHGRGGGGAEMKWVGDSARPRLPRPASGRPRLRFPSRRHPQICRCRDPRWLRGRVPGWGHRCCRARGCFVFCFPARDSGWSGTPCLCSSLIAPC